MDNASDKMLCLMPTFQCTAECSQRGTVNSPRDQTWLPLDSMLSAIDQAAQLGYRRVIFTGGEPTLAGDTLLAAMRHAARKGLPIRMVTNAHWAVDDSAAAARLFEYVCAGLTELNLSTGDQHARFAPHRQPRMSVPVVILLEVKDGNSLDLPQVRARMAETQGSVEERVWSGLTPFAPRPSSMTANRTNVAHLGGCDAVLNTMTVQANGMLRPRHPLRSRAAGGSYRRYIAGRS
jgi:organic radical activating enzyme